MYLPLFFQYCIDFCTILVHNLEITKKKKWATKAPTPPSKIPSHFLVARPQTLVVLQRTSCLLLKGLKQKKKKKSIFSLGSHGGLGGAAHREWYVPLLFSYGVIFVILMCYWLRCDETIKISYSFLTNARPRRTAALGETICKCTFNGVFVFRYCFFLLILSCSSQQRNMKSSSLWRNQRRLAWMRPRSFNTRM